MKLSHQTRIKVYGGLSLTAAQCRKILPTAKFVAPIRRGDLLKDVQDNVHIVAIIDGGFEQSLAISCDEIRDAIRSGVRVFGASSMGAMRAAELRQFGMVGHGEIYNLILNTPGFRDDFLAQTFAQTDTEIHPLTMTYVDFYFAALKDRHFSIRDREWTLRQFAKMFYSQRNLSDFQRKIQAIGRDDLLPAIKRVFASSPSQKNIDAIGLLKKISMVMLESSQYEFLNLKKTQSRLRLGITRNKNNF